MILSDRGIKEALKKGEIEISPFDEKNLQPASYDLHLDNKILIFDKNKNSLIDIKQPIENLMNKIEINDDGFILHPGEFVLANILEITGVNQRYVGRLEGKSSLARIGLLIHATAGFLDPGNSLRLTLEMANLAPLPIKLYPNMKIAQIAFESLDQDCEKPYGSDGLNNKYKGDKEVQASKMWKNF